MSDPIMAPVVPPVYAIRNEIVKDPNRGRETWIASCRDSFDADGNRVIDSEKNAAQIVAAFNAYPKVLTTLEGLRLEIKTLPASPTKSRMRAMINAVLKQVPTIIGDA